MHNLPNTTNHNPANEQLAYLLARAQYSLAVRLYNRALSWLGPIPNPATDPVAFEVWTTLARSIAKGYKLNDLKEKVDRATGDLLEWGRRELAGRGQLGAGALLLLDSTHPRIRECVLAKLAGWDTTSPERWPQTNN